jgi:hypothetical protein
MAPDVGVCDGEPVLVGLLLLVPLPLPPLPPPLVGEEVGEEVAEAVVEVELEPELVLAAFSYWLTTKSTMSLP